MINSFILYSTVSGFILLLYTVGLSEYCSNINIQLLIFVLTTIFISCFLGLLYRNKFKKNPFSIFPVVYPEIISLLLVLAFGGEILYCGKSVLLEIIAGNLGIYGNRNTASLPSIHFLLTTFSSFFSLYLFALTIVTKKIKYIFYYLAVIVAAFVLFANRGGLMFSFFMSLNFWLYYDKVRYGIRSFFKCMVILMIVLFLFGVAGNIRQGYSWSDSSYIVKLGKFSNFNSKNILASYAWAYIYIVQAMFNFNYNVEIENVKYNYLHYVKQYIPDFINKRFYPKESPNIKLVFDSFNTSIGFVGSYVSGGMIGVIIMYLIFTLLLLFILEIFPIKSLWSLFLYLVIDAIIVFFFFTNSWQYSGMSFQLVYPILMMFLCKKLKVKYLAIRQ